MVDPVGFAEAWKAQFPESEPPKMELNSVADIEQELEKCKCCIRRLEMEVNKERFRMIYLQTLLAKEKKSYDRQRWGFKRVSQVIEGSQEHQDLSEKGETEKNRSSSGEVIKPRVPVRKQSQSELSEPLPDSPHHYNEDRMKKLPQETERFLAEVTPSKRSAFSSRRMGVSAERDGLPDSASKDTLGNSVASLRSNFERVKRANSHSAGDCKVGGSSEKPFYVNLEYHYEKGLVKVNDKDVSDKISNLGSQAMQMERKKSSSSQAGLGTTAPVAGDFRRPVYRGRTSENSGYDAEYEDIELNPRFLKDNIIRPDGSKQTLWQPVEFQPYQSVYVGGIMEGEGKAPSEPEKHLTWPRRSYSPATYEDIGGGYTPDCSSNENLTSSEEDFSSGQSSHVSPSPTTTTYRMFREKSRSPSQNSQQSFESSSPPTPQSQKRHRPQVVVSEATIVGVRKTGQIWPNDGNSIPSGVVGQENSFHLDTDASFIGTPPSYDVDHVEEQRCHQEMMPYIDDSPSSSPHFSSKSRGSRDTLSSGSLESTKSSEPDLEKGLEMRKWVLSGILASEEVYLAHLEALLLPMKPLKAAATTSQPVLTNQQIETIFFKVPELYEIHKDFFDHLFPRVQQWSLLQCVGDLFQKLASQLGVYRAFVDNYEVAVEMAEKCCQANPQFADIFENIKVRNAKDTKDQTTKNSLETLLYKPVDRVTRNTLVLHDLIKHTPVSHPDYSLLQDALRISQNFLSSINEEITPRRQSMTVKKGEHRQLLKDSFMVELVEGARKLRHVFLFTDLLLCAKLKKQIAGKIQQYDCKWYIPLADLSFQMLDESDSVLNIPVVPDEELETLKMKISQLKNEMQREKKANKGFKVIERLKKKLSEQKSLLLLTSPNMAFRVHNRNGKSYTFLISSDYERAEWRDVIKEQQKKCFKNFSLTSVELQMLTNSCVKLQTVHSIPLTIYKEDDEAPGLYGFLNVIVHSATGFKQSSNLYCTLEVDSFGYFVNKAKTRVYRDTTEPIWNEEFEIELEGSQTLRLLCYEKCYNKNKIPKEDGEPADKIMGKGQIQLDAQTLQDKDWQKIVLTMNGVEAKLSVKFTTREFSLKRMPSRKQTGVFGVKIGLVTKRERSKVPYIVRECVEEIERRGMEEVGIYRVSGVATDIQALKAAFDSNDKDISVMMNEMDVNAIAGTLKLYFRELPEPLFTDELYPNFAEGIALSEPVAKESCMLNLLLSLPEPNFGTFLFLLEHLKRVAEKESINKMSPHNLATVFGPTLLRPSEKDSKIPTNPTQPISMADSWSLEVMSQTKKPQEMKSPQPPVCIIENIDGQLRPCESGLKILESIELPLVVVAVFGMYRTGKSYLMNRLCNKKQGFSLGSTIQPHTKGIWMWGLPHPKNPEYCLLLLDTEGMGDTKKGDETSDKWLFVLSLLMSSLFIYNSMKQIDQHAISDLHIVTKLKNFIKIKTQTNDSKEEDELWETCLPFVWVIRDFCLEMEIEGKEVTADEYLETCLLPNQEKNEEYNECRKCITELFPERKCFIFPQPTTKKNHLRNLENVADSELDEEFVAEITKLRDYVYSRAEPRIVQGVPLNGRMLSTLLQTFTECIGRGDAPSLQTIVQSMADRENSKVVAAAETCYRESMDKLVLPVNDAFKLQQHHIESERKAFDVFKQLYFPDKDYKFQNELKVKLKTLFQQYHKKNEEESEMTCRIILTRAFKEVEEKHMNGEYAKPGGYQKYMADWHLAEEEYLSTKGKGPKGEKVLLEFKKNKAGEANLLAMAEYVYWKTKESEAEKQKVTITEMEEKLSQEEMATLQKQKEMEEDHERQMTELIQTFQADKQKTEELIEALMQSELEKQKH